MEGEVNIERIQLHQKFNRLFGGDNEFESKVIAHFRRFGYTELGVTRSLMMIPDSIISEAIRKPMSFRMKVENES